MTPYCPQARLDSGPYEVNFFAFGMLKYLLRRSGISWSGKDASSDSTVFTRKQKRRPPSAGASCGRPGGVSPRGRVSVQAQPWPRKQKRRPPFPGGGAPEASGEAIRTSCGRRP